MSRHVYLSVNSQIACMSVMHLILHTAELGYMLRLVFTLQPRKHLQAGRAVE